MITGGGGGGGGGGTIPGAQQGTLAARPAPTTNGLLYYATDTNQIFVTNGAGNAWQNTGSLQFGTAAGRPAAAATNANAVYYATDTGEPSFSNGAAWNLLLATSAAVFKAIAGDIAATGGTGLGSQFYPTQKISNLSNGSIDIIGAGLRIENVGQGLSVKEGSNAKQGTIGSMTAGSIAVANTSVTANSRIFVCRNAGGTNPGAWYVSAQTAGTGFTASSTNAADTGTGIFQIFEPG